MARTKKNVSGSPKKLVTQQSVDQAIKSICDIMRRGNCAGAMQYVPELTWILFLRILDEREKHEEESADILGVSFQPSLIAPYRWRDWAAPNADNTRAELTSGATNSFFNFVNTELLPYLKNLENLPNATPRQKVISEIMSGVDRVRIDTERNLLDVLDKIDQIQEQSIDPSHVFTLSQVYEGLLLKMGEKGNDGGQFFTPRQVIKAMVQVINPVLGETIYDPSCGTGGFLAQACEYILSQQQPGATYTGTQLETLKHDTFWGREKENLIYPIGLANLILHGIDKPNLWHGNTLTGQEVYGGLFEKSPATFDVILSNPPFGGKEGVEAQVDFDYKTSATQVLFLQHILKTLKPNGRCGIVLDEGLLFRTNEDAFVKTKRKLLDECELWCIVSLPGGVFTAAGAGVKTNLLFFTKGKPTETIWYYDLSQIKVGKKTPLTLDHFQEFFDLLPQRGTSDGAWVVNFKERKRQAAEEARPYKQQAATKSKEAAEWTEKIKELKKEKPRNNQAIEAASTTLSQLQREARELNNKAKEIEDAVYDLKAVNPHRKPDVDTRTPEELIQIIEDKGIEIANALKRLRAITVKED